MLRIGVLCRKERRPKVAYGLTGVKLWETGRPPPWRLSRPPLDPCDSSEHGLLHEATSGARRPRPAAGILAAALARSHHLGRDRLEGSGRDPPPALRQRGLYRGGWRCGLAPDHELAARFLRAAA